MCMYVYIGVVVCSRQYRQNLGIGGLCNHDVMPQVRLEQRTDEEALHSSEMKKQELLNKKQQLSERR